MPQHSVEALARSANTRASSSQGKHERRHLLLLLTIWIAAAASLSAASPEQEPVVFQGIVHDGETRIAGATVRIQATDVFAKTDSAGRFILRADGAGNHPTLTAWAPGFYIGCNLEPRPGEDIEIVLERYDPDDHPEYAWVSAFSEAGNKNNCQKCHAGPNGAASELPFDQWRLDAHANSARNPRFLSMYLGTDIHGNKSPPTQFRSHPDYGKQPMSPASDVPYYGPGYRLDFPTTAGNCATCHVPMAAAKDPYGVDPSKVSGVSSEGIGCDFCHKVADVVLDPKTGLPYDNRPGVLSMTFQRPARGHQYFAGPFDDVAPGEDVYSPLQTESRYCAPCHSARFWDVEVYNSYGEWLASPYARADSLVTCQDCHMPPGLSDHFAVVDSGGRHRDPARIFSHRMPGAEDEQLLREAIDMAADARQVDNGIEVRVDIVNSRTGHHVPTDSPLRHMILIVIARDADGTPLQQRHGPVLPEWCGVGDPEQGYLAGLPGKAYAKVLQELWTGVSPTGAYWNQTRLVSDTRIPAFGLDASSYVFDPPASGRATIDVRLLYRRAFIKLRDWKDWDLTDMEMVRESLTLGVGE